MKLESRSKFKWRFTWLKKAETSNWVVNRIREYRIRRNSKNIYKVLLVFVM
jgi:hypothetical protein